jgi:poly-beta-1,6-N-acetyl-D-glucosamine synthase
LSWERRTRVMGSALWVIWRKRAMLRPRGSGVAGQIWGHKLWRSTLGPLSHVALLLIAIGAARRSSVARVFLLGNAVAVGAAVAQQRDLPVPRLLRIPAQVMYLQAVAFGGMLRFLRRDRAVLWSKPDR